MAAKMLVLFYSTYGHSFKMAQAAVEGVTAAGGIPTIKRIPETLSREILEKMHALEAQTQFQSYEHADVAELPTYDGIIWCFATRFGMVPAQLKTFWDATGKHWMSGALSGKPTTVMVTTNTQHGGQEAAILSFHHSLLHQGFIIVGLPAPTWGAGVAAVQGCSPYGASSIAGSSGERMPSDVELEGARIQAKHITNIARKLAAP